MVDVIGHVVEP